MACAGPMLSVCFTLHQTIVMMKWRNNGWPLFAFFAVVGLRSSHSSDVAPGHGRCQEGMAGSALAQQGFRRPDEASNGNFRQGGHCTGVLASPGHCSSSCGSPLASGKGCAQAHHLCQRLHAPDEPLRLLQSSQLRSAWLPSSPGRHPSWSGHPLHPQLARLPRPCPAKPQLRRARATPMQPPADLMS